MRRSWLSARPSSSRGILETAAGTGIVTRALHRAAPQAQIVATDLNPVMLEVAAQNLRSPRVSFQPADAQELPFDDESFDLVVCQFGVMFFPDKVRAHREARRVLRSNSHYLLVSFGHESPLRLQSGRPWIGCGVAFTPS